jgi:NADH:ubiquinone oxidoreductase subunit 3 (subunit A)
MKVEREDFSKTTIASADGMPTISFGADGSGLSRRLISGEGFEFSAFYHNGKLAFVLDSQTDAAHPNALLVLRPDGGRKWDDILSVDFGVNLKDIRPKKDNKYQKLDIEYSGLDIYGAFAHALESGGDVISIAKKLADFRDSTARRAAEARFDAAQLELITAGKTMQTADAAAGKQHAAAKEAKAGAAKAKRSVGKIPNKEAAAKILKLQARAEKEAASAKRAEVRSRRAARRVLAAEKDMIAAKKVLDMTPANRVSYSDVGANIIRSEREAGEMAEDKEIQPLFGKDPEIIDESIAFRPVGFEETPQRPVSPQFVPAEAPALREEPELKIPQSEVLQFVPPVVNSAQPIVPPEVTQAMTPEVMAQQYAEERQQFQQYQQLQQKPIEVQPVPRPDFAPVAVARPYSPNSGYEAPIRPVGAAGRKSLTSYYVMLGILIVLSILTLWLYQKRMLNKTPNLVSNIEITQQKTETKPAQEEERDTGEDPFFGLGGAQQQPESEPEPIEQPLPMEEPEPYYETPVEEPAYDAGSTEYSNYLTEPEEGAQYETEPTFENADYLNSGPAESWDNIGADQDDNVQYEDVGAAEPEYGADPTYPADRVEFEQTPAPDNDM